MKDLFKPEKFSYARYIAVMGLLFAVSSALNILDSAFSAFLPAGMRAGLSNIVVMAAIVCINLPSALLLTLLKALMVLVTRGFTAGVMSFCGGLAAFAVTAVLFRRTNASYILISVLGALSHSAGQLAAASVLMKTASVFAYGAILAVSSVLTGICTGLILKAVLPQMKRILPAAEKNTDTSVS